MLGQGRQKKLARLQSKLREKAGPVKRVLSTPDGQVLLNALKEEFCGDLLGETEQETAFNVGGYEVVRYLELLVKFEERVGQGDAA